MTETNFLDTTNQIPDNDFDNTVDNQNQKPAILEFPKDVRNAIITILKRGALYRRNNEKVYKTLIVNQEIIESYLRNINLKLVIINDAELVYIQNLDREDEQTQEDDDDTSNNTSENTENSQLEDTYLINKHKMTVYASIVLFVLRKYYHERTSQGETQVMIDVDFIQNLISPYLKTVVSTTSNSSNLNGTLKKFAEKKIVEPVQDSNRFEILSMIRYMIGDNELKQLDQEYNKLIKKNSSDFNDNEEDVSDNSDFNNESSLDEDKESL